MSVNLETSNPFNNTVIIFTKYAKEKVQNVYTIKWTQSAEVDLKQLSWLEILQMSPDGCNMYTYKNECHFFDNIHFQIPCPDLSLFYIFKLFRDFLVITYQIQNRQSNRQWFTCMDYWCEWIKENTHFFLLSHSLMLQEKKRRQGGLLPLKKVLPMLKASQEDQLPYNH